MAKSDFAVVNHGSLVQFTPQNKAASAWVSENLPLESWQWMGRSFFIDHRFADPIIGGISDNGFTIRSH